MIDWTTGANLVLTVLSVGAALYTSTRIAKQAAIEAKLAGIAEQSADDTRALVAVTREYTEHTKALADESRLSRMRSDLPVLQCRLSMPEPPKVPSTYPLPAWTQEQWLEVENTGAGPALNVVARFKTKNRQTAKVSFNEAPTALDVISGAAKRVQILGVQSLPTSIEEATVEVELTYQSIHGLEMKTTDLFQSYISPDTWKWTPIAGQQKVGIAEPINLAATNADTSAEGRPAPAVSGRLN